MLYRLLAATFALLLFGCGPKAADQTESTQQPGPQLKVLPSIGDSEYLDNVFRQGSMRPVLVPTPSGLLVAGGASPAAETDVDGEFRPEDSAVLLHEDGSVSELPPLPDGGMANLAGSAFGDAAFLVGVRCSTGALEPDTSAITCEDGTPELIQYSANNRVWSSLEIPSDASAPGGFLGDQAIYALAEGGLVYTVVSRSGQESGPEAWWSADSGGSWERIDVAGSMCAVEGRLVALTHGGSDEAAMGEIPVSTEPSGSLQLSARVFDTGDASWTEPDPYSGGAAVVSGSLTTSCASNVGLFSFAMTGGTAGRIIIFAPKSGWTTIDDEDGARFMETLPATHGALLPQIRTNDVVRFQDVNQHANVSVSESSTVLAGVGSSVLVIDADGQPAIE